MVIDLVADALFGSLRREETAELEALEVRRGGEGLTLRNRGWQSWNNLTDFPGRSCNSLDFLDPWKKCKPFNRMLDESNDQVPDRGHVSLH